MVGIWGGLYFLTFLTAIMLVIRWCLQSEGNGSEGSKHGIFAMKDAQKKGVRSRWSPPQR